VLIRSEGDGRRRYRSKKGDHTPDAIVEAVGGNRKRINPEKKRPKVNDSMQYHPTGFGRCLS